MSKLNQEVARYCASRMEAHGLKGKARKRAALHFVCGASSAAMAMRGKESPAWSELSMFACFFGINGYEEVEKFASDPARQGSV